MITAKPYIIGICGGSASGKSFLLRQLISHLPHQDVTLISQDNYYKRLEEQPRDEEGLINFDHPDSVMLDELFNDLQKLIHGIKVQRLEYTFEKENATPKILDYNPTKVILVEGLFIFHLEKVAKLIDLKIFVEAEEHIRLSRRIKRDYAERGYAIHHILKGYEKFVAPMYYKFVAPVRNTCDVIIPNNKHMYKAINVLANHINYLLAQETSIAKE